MSESTELATATSQPVARREFARVESAMGIMDTSRFEHLGRVAQVMARAGLMPESLTHFKPEGWRENTPLSPLPYEVVVARAYLIANQADLWNADPNAVAQCTSIVHGKLMYEGKLVHGIISAKLGVDLLYEFGTYRLDLRDIVLGDMPKGEDQSLGVRVSGTLPGEAQPRTVSGSVAMWHKGSKSPWGAVTAWPRQLRYMGAREWARAHKPSLLLGIITDDELDEYDLARQTGRLAPAAPQALHSGFEDKRITGDADTYLDPKASVAAKRAARKAADKPQEPEKTVAATDAPADTQTAASEAAAALDGDDLPDGLKERPTETGSAQDAGAGPATSETAGNAFSDGAVETSGQTESEEPLQSSEEADFAEVGHAAPGEQYVMAGEAPLSDGRRMTYKDGDRFAGKKDVSGLTAYDEHAPPALTEEEAANQQIDELPADMPEEVKAYAIQVKGAGSFVEVKGFLLAMQKSDYWAGISEDDRNELRFNTWDIMQANGLQDLPEPQGDISAFRLWLEWEEEPDTITDMLSKLEDTPEFKGKSDGMKENVRGAVAARLEALAE